VPCRFSDIELFFLGVGFGFSVDLCTRSRRPLNSWLSRDNASVTDDASCPINTTHASTTITAAGCQETTPALQTTHPVPSTPHTRQQQKQQLVVKRQRQRYRRRILSRQHHTHVNNNNNSWLSRDNASVTDDASCPINTTRLQQSMTCTNIETVSCPCNTCF